MYLIPIFTALWAWGHGPDFYCLVALGSVYWFSFRLSSSYSADVCGLGATALDPYDECCGDLRFFLFLMT